LPTEVEFSIRDEFATEVKLLLKEELLTKVVLLQRDELFIALVDFGSGSALGVSVILNVALIQDQEVFVVSKSHVGTADINGKQFYTYMLTLICNAICGSIFTCFFNRISK